MNSMIDFTNITVFAERPHKPLDFVDCTRRERPGEHHGKLRIDYFLQAVRAPILDALTSTTHRDTHASTMGAFVPTHIF
jgi:hypothetical protein